MTLQESDLATSRLRTHVVTAGPVDAPTLVLVHGNVSSSRFFHPLMAALADRFRCVAPDLRGFGGSQAAPVDATRGVRDFSDDLHALLTESGVAGPGPWHLLGWSLGAGVVMQCATDYPELIASLVLESPMSPYGFGGTRDVAGTPTTEDFAGSGGGTANPDMVRLIGEGDRTADQPVSPRAVVRGLYVAPGTALDPAEEDAYVEAILQLALGDDNYPGDGTTSPHWPGVAPGTRGVNNAISPRYLDLSPFAAVDPRPPVLWVRGDADLIVSDGSLLDFGTLGRLGAVPGWPGEEEYPSQPMVSQLRAVLDAYAARGGRYREVVWPGGGHSPHLERPAEFAGLVADHLTA